MFFLTLEKLTLNMSLIVTLAFLISKTTIFKRTMRGNVQKTEKALLILMFGKGYDHHRHHDEIQTKATLKALESGEIKLAETKEEIGCRNVNYPLTSALIVPLRYQDLVVPADFSFSVE